MLLKRASILFFIVIALYGQTVDEVKRVIEETGIDDKDRSVIPSELPTIEKISIPTPSQEPGKIPEVSEKLPEGDIKKGVSAEVGAEIKEEIILDYFGYDFFMGRDQLTMWDNLPIPTDYLIGPGDEIIVTLWGDTELRSTSLINREGNVYFEKIGLVNLVGLNFSDAKSLLRSKFEKVYATLRGGEQSTTYMEVSLGTLKSINVRFLGEVNTPGIFPIHPFSTVSTGLMQVGGISIIGSLRDIQVIRDGSTIETVDYYQYLLFGDVSSEIRLQDNDVVFVPVRKSTIRIKGEIKRPAIFELMAGESLDDLIQFVAGLENRASSKVEIHRITQLEDRKSDDEVIEHLWIDLSDATKTKLIDGDQIFIHSIFGTEQKVYIEGQVKNPGSFSLSENMSVLDILELAGGIFDDEFWKKVYPYRADLVRTNEGENKSEIIPIRLAQLREGDPSQNKRLMNNDKLIVYPSDINKYKKVVTIFGEVRNPRECNLDENMGLTDLILRAGGFNYDAYPVQIEVVRVDPFNITSGELSTVLNVEVNPSIFNKYPEIDDFELQDHDQVIVRRHPDFQFQRNVTIGGEIKFPGIYSLEKRGENLIDIIERAGGLIEEAFIEGLIIRRGDKRIILKRKWSGKMDLSIPVVSNDDIYIPRYPGVVEVSGAVNSPGLIQFQKGMSVRDYIKIAGNYKQNADKSNVSLYYSNGESKSRFLYLFDPKVREGCKIVVYEEPETLPFDVTVFMTEATSIVMQSLTIYFIISKLYEKG